MKEGVLLDLQYTMQEMANREIVERVLEPAFKQILDNMDVDELCWNTMLPENRKELKSTRSAIDTIRNKLDKLIPEEYPEE